MKPEPDYSRCSLDDLLDLEGHLDRERFPERWERLQRTIALKRGMESAAGALPPRGWRNFLVVYFILVAASAVLGAIACLSASGALDSTRGESTLEPWELGLLVGAGVFAAAAAWAALACVLLGRGARAGRLISLVLLLLLVPNIKSGIVAWSPCLGPCLMLGLVSMEGSEFRPCALFYLLLDGFWPFPTGMSDQTIAINLMPVLGLFALTRIRPRSPEG
jgi:hypothetical protein